MLGLICPPCCMYLPKQCGFVSKMHCRLVAVQQLGSILRLALWMVHMHCCTKQFILAYNYAN